MYDARPMPMTTAATYASDNAPHDSAATDSYEYDAFGNALQTSGSTPNNYLYRGEQFDPDLGLYYLRARYYNPATGRFLSRDPIDHSITDPNQLHKYLYANGDPVNAIDPSGQGPLLEAIGLQWPRLKVAVKVAAVGLLIAKTMCWLAKVVGAAVDWALGGGPTPMASPGKEFCNALSWWGSPLL